MRNSMEDNFLKEIQTRKEANKQLSSLNMHARRLKHKNNTTSIGFSNGQKENFNMESYSDMHKNNYNSKSNFF